MPYRKIKVYFSFGNGAVPIVVDGTGALAADTEVVFTGAYLLSAWCWRGPWLPLTNALHAHDLFDTVATHKIGQALIRNEAAVWQIVFVAPRTFEDLFRGLGEIEGSKLDNITHLVEEGSIEYE